MPGGNERVFGLDVKKGTKLWEYKTDVPVWNLTPLFPGDGSTVFMDFAGGLYKLNLTTGAELWKTLPGCCRSSFSDGGAGLGPKNHLVHTCSNFGQNFGMEGTTGIVRAFFLSNGTEKWYKMTTIPCNTYPSVGHIANVDPLAVVVAPGSFMTGENRHGEVLALDAHTGDQLWRHLVKPYSGLLGMAAGDAEGTAVRLKEHISPQCVPALWSAPMIDGNGMVIVGRSDGSMYKVYGPESGFKGARSKNVTVDSGTVAEEIHLGSAFLHGALAAAPGIFAISSCDTLYVFQK